MKKFFIKKYIDKITINDIESFALKNNIYLNNQELNIIFNLIKSNWENILNNTNETLAYLKQEFNYETYIKIENLCFMYKQKYQNYLN